MVDVRCVIKQTLTTKQPLERPFVANFRLKWVIIAPTYRHVMKVQKENAINFGL